MADRAPGTIPTHERAAPRHVRHAHRRGAHRRPGGPSEPSDVGRRLNEISADSMVLHALYQTYGLRAASVTSDPLPRVFLEHAAEQRAIIDRLAELVNDLGELAVADPRHAAELTSIERPPHEAEDVPAVLHRLTRAHEAVLARVREAVATSEAVRDWATGDVLGEVLRGNELQAWILAAHLADIGRAPSGRTLRHGRASGAAPHRARG